MTDIHKELYSETNTRFILHDSNGFEPGENDNLVVVKQFIEKRKNNVDIKEQLHAVWYVNGYNVKICSGSANFVGCVSKYHSRVTVSG